MPIAMRSKIITTTIAIPAPTPLAPQAPNAILNPPFFFVQYTEILPVLLTFIGYIGFILLHIY